MSEHQEPEPFSHLTPDEEEALGRDLIAHAQLRRQVAALTETNATLWRQVAEAEAQRDAMRLALALGTGGEMEG